MEEHLDRARLIERYATVASQLHHEQGDREALLKERAQLVERGKKMGMFQTLSASSGDANTGENTKEARQ
jgi:hypothetical protein